MKNKTAIVIWSIVVTSELTSSANDAGDSGHVGRFPQQLQVLVRDRARSVTVPQFRLLICQTPKACVGKHRSAPWGLW